MAKESMAGFMARRNAEDKHTNHSGGTLFGKPRSEVVKHPGAFKAKAEHAGMSTGAYAAKVTKPGSKASAQTKKQGSLAKAFATMRSKKG
jgi:hypothetical protein